MKNGDNNEIMKIMIIMKCNNEMKNENNEIMIMIMK